MVDAPRSRREDYYRVLRAALPARALAVTALGNTSYLWNAMADAPENFYLEDAMGLALPLALGLAVAQPARQVVVVEGDGGLLMHLGSLVTVGAVAPANLTVLLVDNGVHGASGGQPLAGRELDFAQLAKTSGFAETRRIGTAQELGPVLAEAFGGTGPWFLSLLTEPDLELAVPARHLDPVTIRRRFMDGIGTRPYRPTLFGGGLGG